MQNAGALWRDEVSSFNQGTYPDVMEVLRTRKYVSFPVFISVMVRSWWMLGLGDTDFGWRVFGLGSGLSILAALWVTAKLLGHNYPTISLMLIGLSPYIIRIGDSVRAYGPGILFGILTFGTFYWVAKAPRRLNVVLATLCAVCAVQSLYQDAFFVFAAALGAMAVCGRHRQWKRMGLITGMGALAALSLVPYALALASVRSWSYKYPATLFEMLSVATQTMDSPNKAMLLFWALALCAGFFAIAEQLRARSTDANGHVDASREDDDRLVYAFVFLVAAVLGFMFFLRVISVYPFPRHYVPLVALIAVSLDSLRSASHTGSSVRASLAGVAILVFSMASWESSKMRQTNVDILAAKLAESTSASDLIIVYPWYMAVSFNHYYKGDAPWTSVPPLDDYSIDRYDLFQERMTQTEVMQPVIEGITQTLAQGAHVWIVGARLPELKPGEVVGEIELAPHPVTGWYRGTYREHWARQVADALRVNAAKGTTLTLPSDVPINPFENLRVTLFSR